MSGVIEKENTESVLCKYEFSEAELKEIGNTMAEAIAQKDKLADQLKTIAAKYKAEIQKHEADYRLASQQVKNGYEMREVECTVELYPQQKLAIFIRTDTLQEAGRRPMEPAEFQLKLA